MHPDIFSDVTPRPPPLQNHHFTLVTSIYPTYVLTSKVVFCDRERLFTLALLLHVATLYMSCQIFVMSQMTGACLNKFYRGQELVDEGARSSGSIW